MLRQDSLRGDIDFTLSRSRILPQRQKITASRRGDLLIRDNAGERGEISRTGRLCRIHPEDIPHPGIFQTESVQSYPTSLIGDRHPPLVPEIHPIEEPDLVILLLIRARDIIEFG